MEWFEGFNPCCVGSFAVAPASASIGLIFGIVSILVVLDHSLWPRTHEAVGQQSVFQSLLCWIIRCGSSTHPTPATTSKFQSLLCWIIRCGLTPTNARTATIRFQSLLCWIIRCGCRARMPRHVDVSVSILVVLDHSLWLFRRRKLVVGLMLDSCFASVNRFISVFITAP